jgi:hypothetical protein
VLDHVAAIVSESLLTVTVAVLVTIAVLLADFETDEEALSEFVPLTEAVVDTLAVDVFVVLEDRVVCDVAVVDGVCADVAVTVPVDDVEADFAVVPDADERAVFVLEAEPVAAAELDRVGVGV